MAGLAVSRRLLRSAGCKALPAERAPYGILNLIMM